MAQSTGATSCLACQKPLKEKNTTKKKYGIQSLSVLLTAFDEEMSLLSIRAQNEKNEKNSPFFSPDITSNLGDSGTNKLDFITKNGGEMNYPKNFSNVSLRNQTPPNTIMLSLLSHNNSFNNVICDNNSDNNNSDNDTKINNNNNINNKIKNMINNLNNSNNANNRPFPLINSSSSGDLIANNIKPVPNPSKLLPKTK